MSLLVTFFVMLVSFADFEEAALLDVLGSLQGGLRAVPVPGAAAIAPANDETFKDVEGDLAAAISLTANAPFTKDNRTDEGTRIISSGSADYYLHLLNNGVSLVIKMDSIFEPGTAQLNEGGRDVWRVAAELMHSVKNEIRVEAVLTEDAPVHSESFTTPWGLGIEQSAAVQKFLVEECRGERAQISTSVRVIRPSASEQDHQSSIIIKYIGFTDMQMKNIPHSIMRGVWREPGRDNG
jgi:hypothetical protein